MMDWYDHGMGYGAGMFLMLFIWASVIGVVVWAVFRLTRTDRPAPQADTPRQILDRRLAAGEIDAEEYAASRRLLDGRGVIAAPHQSD